MYLCIYASVCVRAYMQRAHTYIHTHTLFISLKFERIYFNLHISIFDV